MRYAFIKEHRYQWAISLMCRVLEVAISGFYDWLGRPVSKRSKENERLKEKIIMFHCGSGCTYGSPRMHKDLCKAGYAARENRVARLMRSQGIRGKAKRTFKTTTTSKHTGPRAENLIKQDFTATEPNKLWITEMA